MLTGEASPESPFYPCSHPFTRGHIRIAIHDLVACEGAPVNCLHKQTRASLEPIVTAMPLFVPV
jgi:hypothetical protein